jgi:hypothetical protein
MIDGVGSVEDSVEETLGMLAHIARYNIPLLDACMANKHGALALQMSIDKGICTNSQPPTPSS